MAYSKGYLVIASFHQTLWNIGSVSSGSIRTRNMGTVSFFLSFYGYGRPKTW